MHTANESLLSPIVKWAGGKRWLAPILAQYAPRSDGRLIEPFCGGAAFFFASRPDKAMLADLNDDLINSYKAVRDKLPALLTVLHEFRNDEQSYYRIRAERPSNEVERAARTLYLCRLSFNGIYRVNLAGEFNVPYGHKTWRVAFDCPQLTAASHLFQRAEFLTQDFEATIATAVSGDTVYADPPYTVAHNNNGFLKYNERIFSFEDQRRLAKSARKAAERGARVVISNADHASIRDLYEGCTVFEVNRHSVIGAQPQYRKQISELLIVVKP